MSRKIINFNNDNMKATVNHTNQTENVSAVQRKGKKTFSNSLFNRIFIITSICAGIVTCLVALFTLAFGYFHQQNALISTITSIESNMMTKITSIESEVKTTNKRLDDIDERTNKRLDDIDEQVENTNNNDILRYEKVVSKIDNNTVNNNKKFKEIEKQLSNQESEDKLLYAKVDEIKEDHLEIKERGKRIESKIDENNRLISDNKQGVLENAIKYSNLKENVDKIEKNINPSKHEI